MRARGSPQRAAPLFLSLVFLSFPLFLFSFLPFLFHLGITHYANTQYLHRRLRPVCFVSMISTQARLAPATLHSRTQVYITLSVFFLNLFPLFLIFLRHVLLFRLYHTVLPDLATALFPVEKTILRTLVSHFSLISSFAR